MLAARIGEHTVLGRRIIFDILKRKAVACAAKAVEPVLKAFRESNKALLIDDSGHGSGQKRDGSNPAGGAGAKSPEQQSDAERLAHLRTLK